MIMTTERKKETVINEKNHDFTLSECSRRFFAAKRLSVGYGTDT